jgi:Histidine kinase
MSAQSLIFQDPQHFIWRVEGSNLHRFDGYAWRTFSPSDGLPNVPIQSTFFDSQKRLWLFGMHTSKLIYLDSTHFIHSVINNIGVNDFSISTAWESGDSLFFKDQKTGSLLFLEKNKMALQRFYGQKRTPQYNATQLPLTDCFFDEKTKTIQPKPLAWTSVLNESLKMACVLDNKKWLLATTDNTLLVFEKGKPKRRISLITKELPEFKRNNPSLTSLTVVGNLVFIGCTEGAFFVPKNAFFEGNIQVNAADFNITNTLAQRINLTDNYLRIGKIHQIIPSTSERLQTSPTFLTNEDVLLATENGLFQFKTTHRTVQRLSEKYENVGAVISPKIYASPNFLVLKNDKPLKINGRMTHLSSDNRHQKLVGTTERGGFFYVEKDEIHNLDVLNDQIFTQIESDTEGAFWALSKTQIVKISINNNTFKINRFDLPQPIEHFFMDGDMLHFFGEKGWFSILKNDLKAPSTPPNVVLQSIKIGGEERPIFQEYDNLETAQRTVIVQYLGISPPSLGDILYKYRLFDIRKPFFGKIDTTEWQYTRNRELTLPLDAGRYQLDISAVNKFGVETVKPLSMRFVIAPPIWERGWFWLASMATIGLIIFGIFKGREQQLKQRNEKLELQNEALELKKNFVELELQALQAQMNTHFVANALTAIQGFVMRNDKMKANKYIVDFYTLVRLFLDSSRQNIHPLEKELTLLDRYVRLQQLFYTFECHINIGDDIFPTELDVPTALYQPFVENAIVHGLRHRNTEGGLLTINFERTKHTFTCRIEDNGVGREKSWAINQVSDAYRKFSTSVSTKIIEKRRATLNQTVADKVTIRYEDLKNSDGSATGTRVIITTRLEEEA